MNNTLTEIVTRSMSAWDSMSAQKWRYANINMLSTMMVSGLLSEDACRRAEKTIENLRQ